VFALLTGGSIFRALSILNSGLKALRGNEVRAKLGYIIHVSKTIKSLNL